jgi:hypothetical protein
VIWWTWMEKNLSRYAIHRHIPAYEGGTDCFETTAYKFQTHANYPEESIQYSEHVERLKWRIRPLAVNVFLFVFPLILYFPLSFFQWRVLESNSKARYDLSSQPFFVLLYLRHSFPPRIYVTLHVKLYRAAFTLSDVKSSFLTSKRIPVIALLNFQYRWISKDKWNRKLILT